MTALVCIGEESTGSRCTRASVMTKSTEEQLLQQIDFYKALLNSLPIPFFAKDRDGRYVDCNRAFEATFGVDRDDLVGKTVDDLWPADLARKYREMDRPLLEHVEDQEYEAVAEPRDGQRRQIHFHKASIADASGQSIGLVGVALDVTPERATEKEMEAYRENLEEMVRQKSARLDAALADKAATIANISRAIRTPLHAVVNFSNLGVTRCAPRCANDDPGPYCAKAGQRAERLLHLVDQFLEQAEREAGEDATAVGINVGGAVALEMVEQDQPVADPPGRGQRLGAVSADPDRQPPCHPARPFARCAPCCERCWL